MTSKLSRLALATAAGLMCLFINDNWSSSQQPTFTTPANARIGRPLTPGSIAGVNRRVDRRAYRRGYYGQGSGYYRPGLGLAAGAALGAAAVSYDDYGSAGTGYYANTGYYGNTGYTGYTGNTGYNGDTGYYGNTGYTGYYGNSGYAATAYDTSGGDTYLLHGNYVSEADAVAYCTQRFRSYDPETRTYVGRGGQRVSCPQ
jgi:hypothetical protein